MNKSLKISDSQLKQILKDNSVRKIIYMHIEGTISLTSKQLDYLLNLEHEIL
mgnify:FL=1